MNDQARGLRGAARAVWRHKRIVGAAAVLGLLGGVVFTLLNPPMFASKALVLLPPPVKGIAGQPARNIGTQVVIAGSDPVLAGAMRGVNPPVSLKTLSDSVLVSSLSPDVVAISARGTTPTQAEEAANAVANSYIAYIRSPGNPNALVLERATNATGTPLAMRLAVNGGIAALLGALAGAIVALAISRGDRRLRQRDEIADAAGAPVLASIPVRHPSDAAGWTALLDDYQPGEAPAWSLDRALHHLGLTGAGRDDEASLAVVTFSTDRAALALGPQLAVYAASLGIPTALVIGPQQDADATATLQAACAAPPAAQSKRSGWLRVGVRDPEGNGQLPNATLTVVVTVVDAQAPRVADTMRAASTVLGVSAGAVTAEQLARVAVGAARGGREIAGILVADPYPADHTTGRLPQPAQQRPSTSPTRTMTESRW
jgi:capsular polysaccharide biosynthesis protein